MKWDLPLALPADGQTLSHGGEREVRSIASPLAGAAGPAVSRVRRGSTAGTGEGARGHSPYDRRNEI